MKDDEEPGPSSALLSPSSAASKTQSKHSRIPKPGKGKGKGSPGNVVTVTEMKEVSPKGSPATTPSSSSSYVMEDSNSKRVVYSIFPPIHDTVMFGLTRRQLLTLATLALTEFFSGMVYSIQAPFFPGEVSCEQAKPAHELNFVENLFTAEFRRSESFWLLIRMGKLAVFSGSLNWRFLR